jgi:threonine/homoserine/homoserine lactone efflux protein
MWALGFRGMLLGLAIAAPVGPIGVLCIRRTLAFGLWTGVMSGLGAATADAIYGSIAGFGLTVVADFLVAHAATLRWVGGLFLCYLGVTTFRTQPSAVVRSASGTGLPSTVAVSVDHSSGAAPLRESQGAEASPSASMPSLAQAYGSTLALTLTNPATIFSFAAIFAGMGLVELGQNYAKSGVLVLGVFGGSALWWLCLSGTVNLVRSRLTPRRMQWLNRVSGIVIFTFGLVALAMVV